MLKVFHSPLSLGTFDHYPYKKQKTNMDYQHLLFKYMQHLYKVEDSVFLELANTPISKITFTPEELEALRAIEEVIENNAALKETK